MFRHLCLIVLTVAICNGALEQPERNPICTKRNNYYRVEGSCDAYIECRDYMAQEMLCPDGLHYNPSAPWPTYPCGYSMDITCEGRGEPQPAIPTPECPHQYGFYPSLTTTPGECGRYRMCVAGQAIEMMCPPGLAFNSVNAHCDWPDLVTSCDSEAFLGFKCPQLPLLENGEINDAVINYRYEGNCYAFYSCERGHAHLLTCDAGFAFDPVSGRCEDADKVKCADAGTTTTIERR